MARVMHAVTTTFSGEKPLSAKAIGEMRGTTRRSRRASGRSGSNATERRSRYHIMIGLRRLGLGLR